MNGNNLDGLAALVTGGGTGIGREIAFALARAGAAIAIADVSDAAAAETAARIKSETGVDTTVAHCDVADEDSVSSAARRVLAEFKKVDILVNNAGIMVPRLEPSYSLAVHEFDQMLSVHLRGTFLMCRQLVPGMASRRFGRVVNLSSVLGLVGAPYRAAYSIAKSGLIAHTRTLAIETARCGITVNAVAPGYILTDRLKQSVANGTANYDRIAERTPAGRWGEAADVARVVTFLCSPASSYITGTVIPVDGGYSARGDPGDDIGPRPDALPG